MLWLVYPILEALDLPNTYKQLQNGSDLNSVFLNSYYKFTKPDCKVGLTKCTHVLQNARFCSNLLLVYIHKSCYT